MKLIIKALVVVFISTGIAVKSYSQDLHLSQFDAAPLYFNPALSGNFDGIHRFIGNWRSQWNVYNSALFSYDAMLPDKFSVAGGKFGLGGIITKDQAGVNTYGYTNLHLLPSFHVPIIPNNILFLSAGIDLTMTQNGIDKSSVVTGSMFDPTTGNSTSGYNGLNTSVWYFDMAAGINAYSMVQGKYPINLGITLCHLLKPGKSLLGANSLGNPRRFNINANTVIPIDSNISLLPSLIWIKQNPSDEVNVGSFVKYAFKKSPYAGYLGTWWRVHDALIVGAAIDFPGFQPNHVVNVGISYDITLSGFAKSSTWDTRTVGKNSIEVSLKYIIKKGLFKYQPPVKLNPVIF
jgi:type IX secretion system PorP/SprF family membrane protein